MHSSLLAPLGAETKSLFNKGTIAKRSPRAEWSFTRDPRELLELLHRYTCTAGSRALFVCVICHFVQRLHTQSCVYGKTDCAMELFNKLRKH